MLPNALQPNETDHVPVLAEEVRELLAVEPGHTLVDATFGSGGHAAVLAADLKGEGRSRSTRPRFGSRRTPCPADVFVIRAAVLESACRESGADGRHHRLCHRRRLHHDRPDRMVRPRIGGWLRLAALWETLILPDNPLRSLNLRRRRSPGVPPTPSPVCRRPEHSPGRHAVRWCRKGHAEDLDRARKCRSAIERQSPGAVMGGFGQTDVDRLRVALHSARKGLDDMADVADSGLDAVAAQRDRLVDQHTLHALADALHDDVDEESRGTVGRRLGYCAATFTKR